MEPFCDSLASEYVDSIVLNTGGVSPIKEFQTVYGVFRTPEGFHQS
jgi:hypothetical protein